MFIDAFFLEAMEPSNYYVLVRVVRDEGLDVGETKNSSCSAWS